MSEVTRRVLLAGMVGSAALPAAAIDVSPRPLIRPRSEPPPPLGDSAAALIEAAGLSGQIGYVLAHASSGRVIDSLSPEVALPPASVAKAITSAYALETLGPAHRFQTRVLGTGPLRGGRLEGDLVLAGSGAPGLSTDDLASMAGAVKTAGLREISGRFLIWTEALPLLRQIDDRQPEHLGYNPAISGLNLNFNRVHFEWQRRGNGYDVTMEARTAQRRPQVGRIAVSLSDRRLPVFRHQEAPETGEEEWSVARGALGQSGARWLPVRRPGLYAGEVFRDLLRSHGIELPAPALSEAPPPERPVLAMVQTAPLRSVARGMMRFSTNLTAEVLGLSATVARRGGHPSDLAASGAEMSAWARTALAMNSCRFVDHSGLGDASRVAPQDMVRALVSARVPLLDVMRTIPISDDSGRAEPFELRAKTGTLNFVSALAGFVGRDVGPDLAFAVFTADLERRAAIPPGQEERPPGSLGWSRRSRRLQYDLVRLWARRAT